MSIFVGRIYFTSSPMRQECSSPEHLLDRIGFFVIPERCVYKIWFYEIPAMIYIVTNCIQCYRSGPLQPFKESLVALSRHIYIPHAHSKKKFSSERGGGTHSFFKGPTAAVSGPGRTSWPQWMNLRRHFFTYSSIQSGWALMRPIIERHKMRSNFIVLVNHRISSQFLFRLTNRNMLKRPNHD